MTTSAGHRTELGGADVRVLLWHTALYGLASILHEAGCDGVRFGWTRDTNTTPWVAADNVDDEQVGRIVRDHAAERSDGSWVQADVTLSGSTRGLMSPRLSGFSTPAVWEEVRTRRESVLDEVTARSAWADLSYLAALGEPAYWSRDRTGRTLQDDGASRLEMQPRNQGSEFVGSRLRKVAASTAARAPGTIMDGLTGRTVVDEVGGDRPDSRTPTGLAAPGPTDNAIAWCALWGLGQFPTVPRIQHAATTSGHLGGPRDEWFYVPVWTDPWRTARLRSVLASAQLGQVAAVDLHRRWSPSDDRAIAARAWLAARGVHGTVRFPIHRFGSDNAPERRAMRGEIVRGISIR